MKASLTLVIFFFSFAVSFNIYAQPYQSRVGEGQFRQIDITMQGSTCYYDLYSIADGPDGVWIHMISDIDVDDEGNFTIPDDENTYWLVPFDGNNPVELIPRTYNLDCGCHTWGQGPQDCNATNPKFCRNAGCKECGFAVAGGSSSFQTGGVILIAEEVIRN
jgi:hypothetical protein